MKLNRSKNPDELCYPFIYEHSLKCDYEILTDELCRKVGGILAAMPPEFPEVTTELEHLQPLLYHLNGSIRGRLALEEEDVVWLRECYARHRDASADAIEGFVLPRGAPPIPELNAASSMSKKVIRLMVRLHQHENVEVPDILHRFANVLCNYFFTLTIVINRTRGVKEIPFQSRSYGPKKN